MEFAVEAVDLTKRFEDLVAVDKLNLQVKRGEIFGLLGPNGAGKTTTFRMLTGLTLPTSGSATVAGFDVVKEPEKVKARIGVLPETSNMYDDLTAWYNLDFTGKLYGIPKDERRRRIDELLKMFQLEHRKHDYVHSFSKGMHRRLTIAAALVHNPEILFFDEPTSGLDAQTSRYIHELVKKLHEQGITIILTTHLIEEADQLCEKVAIIDYGKIVAQGAPSELKHRFQETEVIEIEVKKLDDKILQAMCKLNDVQEVLREANKARIYTRDASEILPHLVSLVNEKNRKIISLKTSEPTLEDVFIQLTGREIREEKPTVAESVRRRGGRW